MDHYSNDESEEGDYVLDNKELVGEVPKWRQSAEIEPQQDCICGDTSWWAAIRGPFHMY